MYCPTQMSYKKVVVSVVSKKIRSKEGAALKTSASQFLYGVQLSWPIQIFVFTLYLLGAIEKSSIAPEKCVSYIQLIGSGDMCF